MADNKKSRWFDDLWFDEEFRDYILDYSGRVKDEFTKGILGGAKHMASPLGIRDPRIALGGLRALYSPITPWAKDISKSVGDFIAPGVNRLLGSRYSRTAEALGRDDVGAPQITGEQIAPFLTLAATRKWRDPKATQFNKDAFRTNLYSDKFGALTTLRPQKALTHQEKWPVSSFVGFPQFQSAFEDDPNLVKGAYYSRAVEAVRKMDLEQDYPLFEDGEPTDIVDMIDSFVKGGVGKIKPGQLGKHGREALWDELYYLGVDKWAEGLRRKGVTTFRPQQLLDFLRETPDIPFGVMSSKTDPTRMFDISPEIRWDVEAGTAGAMTGLTPGDSDPNFLYQGWISGSTYSRGVQELSAGTEGALLSMEAPQTARQMYDMIMETNQPDIWSTNWEDALDNDVQVSAVHPVWAGRIAPEQTFIDTIDGADGEVNSMLTHSSEEKYDEDTLLLELDLPKGELIPGSGDDYRQRQQDTLLRNAPDTFFMEVGLDDLDNAINISGTDIKSNITKDWRYPFYKVPIREFTDRSFTRSGVQVQGRRALDASKMRLITPSSTNYPEHTPTMKDILLVAINKYLGDVGSPSYPNLTDEEMYEASQLESLRIKLGYMDLWPKELEEQFKAGQIRIFPVNSVWGVDAVISPESRAEGVGGQKHPGISATDYDLFEEDTGRYIQQFPEWEMRRLVGDNRADPNAWRVIPWGVGDYKEAIDVLQMYESDLGLSSTEFLDMINRRGFFASTENRLAEQEGKSQLARILEDVKKDLMAGRTQEDPNSPLSMHFLGILETIAADGLKRRLSTAFPYGQNTEYVYGLAEDTLFDEYTGDVPWAEAAQDLYGTPDRFAQSVRNTGNWSWGYYGPAGPGEDYSSFDYDNPVVSHTGIGNLGYARNMAEEYLRDRFAQTTPPVRGEFPVTWPAYATRSGSWSAQLTDGTEIERELVFTVGREGEHGGGLSDTGEVDPVAGFAQDFGDILPVSEKDMPWWRKRVEGTEGLLPTVSHMGHWGDVMLSGQEVRTIPFHGKYSSTGSMLTTEAQFDIPGMTISGEDNQTLLLPESGPYSNLTWIEPGQKIRELFIGESQADIQQFGTPYGYGAPYGVDIQREWQQRTTTSDPADLEALQRGEGGMLDVPPLGTRERELHETFLRGREISKAGGGKLDVKPYKYTRPSIEEFRRGAPIVPMTQMTSWGTRNLLEGIRFALENNYDYIVWPTGEEMARKWEGTGEHGTAETFKRLYNGVMEKNTVRNLLGIKIKKYPHPNRNNKEMWFLPVGDPEIKAKLLKFFEEEWMPTFSQIKQQRQPEYA